MEVNPSTHETLGYAQGEYSDKHAFGEKVRTGMADIMTTRPCL